MKILRSVTLNSFSYLELRYPLDQKGISLYEAYIQVYYDMHNSLKKLRESRLLARD